MYPVPGSCLPEEGIGIRDLFSIPVITLENVSEIQYLFYIPGIEIYLYHSVHYPVVKVIALCSKGNELSFSAVGKVVMKGVSACLIYADGFPKPVYAPYPVCGDTAVDISAFILRLKDPVRLETVQEHLIAHHAVIIKEKHISVIALSSESIEQTVCKLCL